MTTHEASSPRDEYGDRIHLSSEHADIRAGSEFDRTRDLDAAVASLQALVDAERHPWQVAS